MGNRVSEKNGANFTYYLENKYSFYLFSKENKYRDILVFSLEKGRILIFLENK